MIRGSCLCGKVQFRITGTPDALSYCHCSRCRKAAGVFSAVLVGKAEHLTITEGEVAIAQIEPGPDWKFKRCFCRDCGTSLGDMVTGDIYVVAASALDDDPGIRPMAHIHTAAKPDWYDILDGVPEFPGDYAPDT